MLSACTMERLLSLFLLKKFGFIDDFYISNPKQRLLPYGILVLLLGFTMYQLNKIELNGLPIIFMGASAVCLILNIIINTRYTISTHAIEHKTMACLKMSISKVGCAHGQTLVFICEKFVTSVMNSP